MWALLLVEEAVDPVFRQSSGRQRRVIEKPLLESLPSGSGAEFRALLGTESQSRLTAVEKQNAFVIKWNTKEAEYPVLHIRDQSKDNEIGFNLGSPIQLFQDPVKLLMIADLWMRNKTILDRK